jgi:hypothetical protein
MTDMIHDVTRCILRVERHECALMSFQTFNRGAASRMRTLDEECP